MKSSSIYVICGGFSDEREVSLRSGANVAKALEREGFTNVFLFDIKDGAALVHLAKEAASGNIDKAYLLTHGTYGEDGCVQGFLELFKVPYTGSNVETSAICMNKTRTKEVLSSHKLPVLPTYELDDDIPDSLEELMFKPKIGGSSVGMQKFNSVQELNDFVVTLDAHDKKNYFVEKFTRGVELTTSIVDIDRTLVKENLDFCFFDSDSNLVSLPLLELRPKKEFYDYEAKYTKGMTEFVLPAAISAELSKKIHQIAINAFKIAGCKTMSRVDFIIDAKTNEPYILEINTLPGMTDTSDLPAQAQCAGISYDQLVVELLQLNYAKTSRSN
ncbi:MAG: D-alanine--D-alanine ligase [Candidatus Caenarcaniphilales bacterium]|jgi:D-alanine-D-alanine ligase|nr:D-alanine--D-alanine ligase [Candidatus Caenarcaniphilales bacterium]